MHLPSASKIILFFTISLTATVNIFFSYTTPLFCFLIFTSDKNTQNFDGEEKEGAIKFKLFYLYPLTALIIKDNFDQNPPPPLQSMKFPNPSFLLPLYLSIPTKIIANLIYAWNLGDPSAFISFQI